MRPRARDRKRLRGESNEAVCNEYRFTVLTFEHFLGARVERFSSRRDQRLGSGISPGRWRWKSADSCESSRRNEGEAEFLERTESGYGKTTGWIVDCHHNSPCSGPALLHIDRGWRGSRRYQQPCLLWRKQVRECRGGS